MSIQLLKTRLFRKVRLVIADQFCVEVDEVTPTAHFIDDLNADSLDLVELIMTLEEKFHIDIPDEEAAEINTLEDTVDFILDQILKQNVQGKLNEERFWDEFDYREL